MFFFEEIKIFRCLKDISIKESFITLYIFFDAFEKVYVVVVYIRYEYEDGNVIIRFIVFKIRLVSLKIVSIFRFEFMGVFIGLRLVN